MNKKKFIKTDKNLHSFTDEEIDRKKNLERSVPSTRLVYTFWTLLCNRRIKKAELLKKLGIKERTFKKYKEQLNNFFKDFLGVTNFEIREEAESDIKYVVLSPFSRIDAFDNSTSIISLFFAKSILDTLKIKELNEKLQGVYNDLLGATIYKSDIQSFLKNINRIFYYHPYAPKDYSDKEGIIKTIIEAIYKKHVIKCEYCSLSNKMQVYILKPYSIVCHLNALYLIAKGDDNSIKTYAIDRFESVKITGQSYDYPGSSEYSPKEYLNEYIGVIGEGNSLAFEIIFRNNTALKKTIKERKWFKNQGFVELPDGRLKMTFTTPLSIEVLRWVNSWGRDIDEMNPNIGEIERLLINR